jgi:hypothetical protein
MKGARQNGQNSHRWSPGTGLGRGQHPCRLSETSDIVAAFSPQEEPA